MKHFSTTFPTKAFFPLGLCHFYRTLFSLGKCKCATNDPMKFWKHRKENHGKYIIPTPHVSKEERTNEHKCVFCEHKTKNLFVSYLKIHQDNSRFGKCFQSIYLRGAADAGASTLFEIWQRVWSNRPQTI